ncbi:hypothetical protein FGG08_004549 [Glutinoglossum americanum]|uniref:Uncharacterized protein n=1 Tax=Glutinoglossum americanum TaxID=1670608 RepID=A0A9P8HW85_9PEZI|nr:hypothetical protein FGG08_004549 [Glutinoglossum americanum]
MSRLKPIIMITLLIASLNAHATMNMTVLVPDGTTNHGDPNLICLPMKWHKLALFYFGNYFAHALTVKSVPGESIGEKALSVLLSITLPYAGVAKGLDAIFRNSRSVKDKLQKAARAGALCVVTRSESWRPPTGFQLYIRDLRIEDNTRVENTPPANNGKPQLSPGKAHNLCLESWDMDTRIQAWTEVHGKYTLCDGYELTRLPRNTEVEWDLSSLYKEYQVDISSAYSIATPIIAIFQVLYASYTLYHSRGDQLRRYGYAAFSLTVVQYLVMSIVNLAGCLCTPNYPCLYVIRSDIMGEAELRGAEFEGVIGSVTIETEDNNARNPAGGQVDLLETGNLFERKR